MKGPVPGAALGHGELSIHILEAQMEIGKDIRRILLFEGRHKHRPIDGQSERTANCVAIRILTFR
jgi:hypothetical protein